MPSPFYTASVVLFQLHGCVVSHIQVIATPLLSVHNWASEASPTLGCSIEISRDIYMYVCMSVCLVCQINCVGGIT